MKHKTRTGILAFFSGLLIALGEHIMKHKTRTGILAFFSGLLIALGALYIDQLRGNISGTIGLYQIVGALTGYMISGSGLFLVMKETEVRKTIQNILFGGGATIVAISVLADYIGVAGTPGFDKFQTLGTIVGILLVGTGFFLMPKKTV